MVNQWEFGSLWGLSHSASGILWWCLPSSRWAQLTNKSSWKLPLISKTVDLDLIVYELILVIWNPIRNLQLFYVSISSEKSGRFVVLHLFSLIEMSLGRSQDKLAFSYLKFFELSVQSCCISHQTHFVTVTSACRVKLIVWKILLTVKLISCKKWSCVQVNWLGV